MYSLVTTLGHHGSSKGNDKFIGAGVRNEVDFGWYDSYATGEFGSDEDGVTLSIDGGAMTATTLSVFWTLPMLR